MTGHLKVADGGYKKNHKLLFIFIMVFNTPSACGGVIDFSFWVQGLPWGLIPFIRSENLILGKGLDRTDQSEWRRKR